MILIFDFKQQNTKVLATQVQLICKQYPQLNPLQWVKWVMISQTSLLRRLEEPTTCVLTVLKKGK